VNTATKITELPALTADLLQSNSCLVDNLFADLWKLNTEPPIGASHQVLVIWLSSYREEDI
jgi:hypothetical protein